MALKYHPLGGLSGQRIEDYICSTMVSLERGRPYTSDCEDLLLRPIHNPKDRVFVQKFPHDIKAGTELSVEIGNVEAELLNASGAVIQPPKRQANQTRQQRFTLLNMEFGQRIVAHELHVNLTTTEVFLVGQIYSPLILSPQILVPLRSTLTTYYARKGKKKVLHAYFQESGHPYIRIDRVLEKYDRVLCVDTNNAIKPNGQKVAVTTALVAKSTRLAEVAMHTGADHIVQFVALDPPPGNPELHGIWTILGHLVEKYPELVASRIAIITDTEFGMVKAWNDRSQPFYDGHMLPADVDIFYATADTGSEEFVPNMLMRACDSLSTQKLREVLGR